MDDRIRVSDADRDRVEGLGVRDRRWLQCLLAFVVAERVGHSGNCLAQIDGGGGCAGGNHAGDGAGGFEQAETERLQALGRKIPRGRVDLQQDGVGGLKSGARMDHAVETAK